MILLKRKFAKCLLASVIAAAIWLSSCGFGLYAHAQSYKDPLGKTYHVTNMSGIYVPENTERVYVLENTFTRNEAASASNTTTLTWRIEGGYSRIETDVEYSIKVDSYGGTEINFVIPASVSEFSVSVHYAFADLFVGDVPLGWALGDNDPQITQNTELLKLAASFSSLDDVFEWFADLKYKPGLDTPEDSPHNRPRLDIETYNDRGGDCDELVYLFISLLEKSTLGIDSRIVLGVDAGAWLDAEANGVPTSYHAVAQVFVDGKWRMVDLTALVKNDNSSFSNISIPTPGAPRVGFMVPLRMFPATGANFVGRDYNTAGAQVGEGVFVNSLNIEFY